MVFRFRNTPYPFDHLRNDVDRMLTGMLGPWAEGSLPRAVRGQPAVNMWHREDDLVVELELPGLKSDQLDVSVVGDQLTLKVERPEVVEEGTTYHRRERPVGSFTRVLRLPIEVDVDHVEAELSDGVLTITLPKAESAKPRKIEVTAAS